MRTRILFTLFFLSISFAQAKNILRTNDEIILLARDEISKEIKVPGESRITLESLSNGRKVVFEMAVPDGFWTMSEYPEVHFPNDEKGAIVRVWNKNKADENSPKPFALSQWFLHKNKQPDQCIELMEVWFEAFRNKGRVVNFQYSSYEYAYRMADREHEWMAVLEKELAAATAPEAIYEIHKFIAKAHQKNAEVELAVQHWELARNAMVSQSDSYRATRYALPYFEIAKIYLSNEDNEKAAAYFERYLATPNGKSNSSRVIPFLGDIYEAENQVDKARELYLTVLGDEYGKNWRNKILLERFQTSIRERLRLLDLKEDAKKSTPELE